LEEKEAKYIRQLNEKVIDEEKFRELIGELDLERAMGESIVEGLATTQDEEIGESEQEELADEEPVAADKVVESSTVGKGKRKAAPARAKVYVAVDKLVSALLKSSSIYANTFACSVTDASCGRQSQSVSQLHMNGAARSARPIGAAALGGGGVTRSSRARLQSPTRDLEGSW
jgi:hypothetical protein